MALTGLFLISFLVIHLIGNFQLLKDDGGKAFNVYAYFMVNNPVIKTISYTLYSSILIHSIWAVLLTIQNRKARGAQGYAIDNKASTLASRNMGILGTFVFIFLVVHMRDFWGVMHFGNMPVVEYDGKQVKDLYTLVVASFSQLWYVVLYVVSMIMLGFHLWHGFISAFQTLGLNHSKYNPLINFVGKTFSVIVPALFAWLPISMFFFK